MGLFILWGAIQERLGYMGIKPLDDRSHKQSGDDGAYAHIGMEDKSYDYTGKIAEDTAYTEGKQLIFVCSNERYGIIAGYAQISGKIQRGGKTGD